MPPFKQTNLASRELQLRTLGMLAGCMRHKDIMGNEGVIKVHGVQWMTAGKGIVHSEMQEQDRGLLVGFRLWVNLPSKDKMCESKYQEFGAQDVTLE